MPRAVLDVGIMWFLSWLPCPPAVLVVLPLGTWGEWEAVNPAGVGTQRLLTSTLGQMVTIHSPDGQTFAKKQGLGKKDKNNKSTCV